MRIHRYVLSTTLGLLLLTILGGTSPSAVRAADTLDLKMVNAGRSEAETIWRRGRTLDEAEIEAQCREILHRLVEGRHIESAIELKIHVFCSPGVNAFALPDGSVYLFPGLLAALDSWDQVAFVLAHESQHAIGWHAQKNKDQASDKSALFTIASLATTAAFSGATTSGEIIAYSFSQIGLNLAANAMISGYGRGLESEADQVACEMLESAGYDVCVARQALEVIARKQEKAGRVSNFFWGSHPLITDRIEDLPVAADDCPDTLGSVSPDYLPLKCRMLRKCAGMWLSVDNHEEALASADRHTELAGPHYYTAYVRGEVFAVSDDPDTLALAPEAYRQSLSLCNDGFRLPWLGLSRLAEARGDTAEAIVHLESYLAGDVKVPNRRSSRRHLKALREGIPVTPPAPVKEKAKQDDNWEF